MTATRTIPMSEKQLQQAVVAYARLLGWRCYHTYDSRRSQAGFPDLVMTRGRLLLFVELKRTGKNPTEAQRQWLSDLYDAGQLVYVWHPEDWQDGTILELLR